MVLRKPYAFLIKHFRSINFIVFLLVLFNFNRTLKLYSFIKDYLETGIYHTTLNPISNYINGYLYLSFLLTITISGILLYLLMKKDKPFITYIYIIVLAILSFILAIYINNYFIYTVPKGFNQQIIRLIRDLVLIDSLLYYPILGILMIRFLGIDLKNFGFHQDEEFLTILEADREEVEVEVKFNKEKYLRMFKNKMRYLRYFVLEHLIAIILIGGVVLLIGIYNGYHYLYVENRIYKQNQSFKANYYQIKINNSYLTDKDYAGNVISSQNRYFLVVDLNIKNLLSDRDFDMNKLFLYVDNNYYLPTTRYNNSFKDMGTTYEKDRMLEKDKDKRYIFIYEIDKQNKNSNFLLKYQDLVSKSKKQIRVKMKILDISSFKEKDKVSLKQNLIVPINEDLSYQFSFSQFEITDNKKYTYESCYLYNCPILEKTLTASKNKKLLFLKVNSNTTNANFISFLKKYGKIEYIVNNKVYTEKINLKIEKYRGNYVYIETSDTIKDATHIKIIFTVRTYQYFYILKG